MDSHTSRYWRDQAAQLIASQTEIGPELSAALWNEYALFLKESRPHNLKVEIEDLMRTLAAYEDDTQYDEQVDLYLFHQEALRRIRSFIEKEGPDRKARPINLKYGREKKKRRWTWAPTNDWTQQKIPGTSPYLGLPKADAARPSWQQAAEYEARKCEECLERASRFEYRRRVLIHRIDIAELVLESYELNGPVEMRHSDSGQTSDKDSTDDNRYIMGTEEFWDHIDELRKNTTMTWQQIFDKLENEFKARKRKFYSSSPSLYGMYNRRQKSK